MYYFLYEFNAVSIRTIKKTDCAISREVRIDQRKNNESVTYYRARWCRNTSNYRSR